MRYHKAHLTRRLILDTSADNEKEENMVEWLRVSLAVILYTETKKKLSPSLNVDMLVQFFNPFETRF
jgi:hypothetical protein